MTGIEGLLAGRTLADRYHVLEVIGRGGMGAVYRARDRRLHREVAVKVITATAVDPDGASRIRRRFQREAAAAARLPHHPNVVPVYDFGTDAALGIDFLVMELLRGRTLAEVLGRDGRLPVAEAVTVVGDAARGVAVGHRAGVVHRDVKPGNIFLVQAEHGETGVRVLDFGIAKVLDEDESGTQLTREGGAPHSPAYASPEQLRAVDRLTPASDVFSLGVVAFQALTGRRPFDEAARNRMSLGMSEAAPSVREIEPGIPGSIDRVLRRAMAYDPEDRYPDASAFAGALREAGREADLRDARPVVPVAPVPPAAADAETVAADAEADDATAIAGGDEDATAVAGAAADEDATRAYPVEPEEDHTLAAPAAAQPPTRAAAAGPPRRPPPPPRRRKHGMGAGFWLPLLLLFGALGFAAWYFLVQPEDPIAVLPPEEVPEVEVPEIDELDEPDELEAFVLNNEGGRLLNLDRLDEAIDHFERAVTISPDQPDFRYNLGMALLRAERYGEASGHLEAAIRLDPRQTNAYALLGRTRLAQGDTTIAVEAFRQFLERSPDPRARREIERQLEAIERARREERIEPVEPSPDTAPEGPPEPRAEPAPPGRESPVPPADRDAPEDAPGGSLAFAALRAV